MSKPSFSIVILAAGKSTRFKSDRSKLLHALAGIPLGEYPLRAAFAAGAEHVYMVVGHQSEEVQKQFGRSGLTFIVQTEPLGTGHALLVARAELERCPSDDVAILVGDAPLVTPELLKSLLEHHQAYQAAATILTLQLDDPHGYGRVIRESDRRVRRILEEKVATAAEKQVREVSSGILCFSLRKLLANLDRLTNDNPQGEYLLTDLIAILAGDGERVEAIAAPDPRLVMGVNDRVERAQAERFLRLQICENLMREGVTIADPYVTYIDDGVMVGRDSVIEPGVSLLGSTRIGSHCHIRANSVITDSELADRVLVRPCSVVTKSKVGEDTQLGPFVHLREEVVVGTECRVGNFVEVKKSTIGNGTKAGHLTYLGNATLGDHVNIGAGTVTCNYDGERKLETVIEDGVFIGSGTMLVAPVRVGSGAYVAAGSAIVEDVPPDSLAIGRARQAVKEGWVKERKARASAKSPKH